MRLAITPQASILNYLSVDLSRKLILENRFQTQAITNQSVSPDQQKPAHT